MRPNAAHHALVALERWQAARGSFLLITQNVDGLHRAAGSRGLVEVHGRADRVCCSRDGCELGAPAGSLPRAVFDDTLKALLDDPRPEHLPRYPACGANLRPHILWFDELYTEHRDFEWQRVFHACDRGRPVLFLGTSLSVGVTELALRCALDRCAPAIVVDPSPPDLPTTVDVIKAKVEELLPAVCERLGLAPRPID